MSGLAQRVMAAMGAGAFGQAVVTVIQVCSLPLFLRHWDTATYGNWLLLTAMPAYLSMTDVGMVATAGNRMTMAMGHGDHTEAQRLFHSAIVFVLSVVSLCCLICLPLALWWPVAGEPAMDQRLTLCALILSVLMGQFTGLADALFRATGRFAQAVFLGNVLRLLEWGGMMTGLALHGSFLAVALGGLLVRLVCTAGLVVMSARRAQGLSWHWHEARLHEIRALIKPALSFMVFPLASALSLQGITLLVGQHFGPVVVAAFNSYRTIARVAAQATGILANAVWGEFSFLFGQGGTAAVTPLYLRALWVGGAGAAALSVVLYGASPWLLRWWSHGHIAFDPWPMALLLAYAAVVGLWHVPRVLLLSTNQHTGLAQWSLGGAVVAVAATLALQGPLGLPGVCLAMLLSELMMAAICLRLAQDFLRSGIKFQPRLSHS